MLHRDDRPNGFRLTLSGEVIFGLVVLAASAHLVVQHNQLTKDLFSAATYLAGEARTPFQYRALVMLLGRIVAWVLDMIGAGGALASQPAPFNQVPRVAFAAVNLACLVMLAYVIRRHLAELVRDRAYAACASVAIFAIIPFNLIAYSQTNTWFPYDIPGIFFFYLLFYLVSTKRWPLFYVIFPIAALNRETVVYVTVIYVLINLKNDRFSTARHAAAQTLIWCAVKGALYFAYRSNIPAGDISGVFMLQLGNNLRYLSNPVWWPQLASTFGFTWVLLIAGFRHLHDRPLRMAAIAFPGYFAIMLVVGWVIELRIYSEFAPIVLVGVATIVFNYLDHRKGMQSDRLAGFR